ncbi:MAG: corrinoid protein [Eubacterium sp.]
MDYYQEIIKAIEEGETRDVVMLVKDAIHQLYPSEKILDLGLIRGIERVAEKFREAELLIPEVIMSTRALQAGLKTIKPYLTAQTKNNRIKVVIGTVSGDLHDIGKNIIKVVVSMQGFEIVDIGIDVSTERFVEAVKKEKPQIIMMSALLTTTIGHMEEIIEMLEKKNLRKDRLIFVGGAPVNKSFALEIGADYYTSNIEELKGILQKISKSFNKK